MARVKGAFLLILAVAMILFGVTFINNAFKGIKEKTTKAVDITEGILTPTREEPLKLEFTKRDIKIGGKTDLTISFMNPSDKEKHCQLFIYDNTNQGLRIEPTEDSWIIYNDKPTSKINPEQITAWKLFIEINKKESKQTKLLTTVVCCADSYSEDEVSCSDVEFRKDFILNII